MTWEEFMDIVRETNKKHQITDESPQVEKLIVRIMSCGGRSNQEILDLHSEIKAFLKSDASEEDKNMLRGYTESLNMVMRGKGLL